MLVAAYPRKAASAGRYGTSMMLVLIIVGLVVIAGSFWADYKWRNWMAGRRRDRQ
jgi:hypothetical protein